MSGGGPPHHSHNRQVPATNPAWNHLQVPNYFPRQPQLAHMSSEHSILHPPSWHTPTTETALKMIPHTHMLSEMLKTSSGGVEHPTFPRDCVDLSLARNGNQNGELTGSGMRELPPARELPALPTIPISLSVRDTNKINSLPASALEIQAVGLNKCTSPGLISVSPGLKSASPGLKSASPGLKSTSSGLKSVSPGLKSVSPGLKSASPGLKSGSPVLKSVSPGLSSNSTATVTATETSKNQKRSNVRVDSILERLNPVVENKMEPEKLQLMPSQSSVIVQATSSFDENSNSSSILNVPTSTTAVKEDDAASMHSNEDSLDSMKSRRKRKPSKTLRVSKEEDGRSEKVEEISLVDEKDEKTDKEATLLNISTILEGKKVPERRRSSDDLDTLLPAKTRRKTSSESETIDNIAAMVQEGLKDKKTELEAYNDSKLPTPDQATKPISVSVIKTKEHLDKEIYLEKNNSPSVKTNVSSPLPSVVFISEATAVSAPVVTTTLVTPAQKKATNTHFVEVENKLQEMFAGIEDIDPLTSSRQIKTDSIDKLDDKLERLDDKLDDTLLKLDDSLPSTSRQLDDDDDQVQQQQHDVTSSTSNEVKNRRRTTRKRARRSRPLPNSRRGSDMSSVETTPKKKRFTKTKPATTTVNTSLKRSPRTSKSPIKKPLAVLQSSTSTSALPTKNVNSTKVETVKDVYAYDSGSNASSSRSRGPFIHIKGPRDSPISISVVNTPTNDEDGEKRPVKTKKFHDDSEYRHKVRSKGLHCSTLSTKYDAQTKDATWICAFCKRGPHASELTGPTSVGGVAPPGDLFGPYVITSQCPEFERRLDDPYERQFKSRKITKALDAAAAQNSKSGGKKLTKRKYSESSDILSEVYLGITEATNKTYEVWAHEDCIVWAPNVFLVGPKIVGLEEAVWTCCNVPCATCKLKGANIHCVKRGCLNASHMCCALKEGWYFDDNDLKAYCPLHRVP